jgi:hypothetical protein
MSPKTESEIDWQPLLDRLQRSDDQHLPLYPGNLKAALLAHAGLTNHPKAEAVYQLATEIARLTTCCDPEIIYWFSRLISLMDAQPVEVEDDSSRVTRRDRLAERLPTFGMADRCSN